MRVVQKALTFDDVLLVPAHSTVLPREVRSRPASPAASSSTSPLVSAAMDTVTEARLAIAIAQEGGIGIVHKNMSPAAQAAEVTKVKRFESGVVKDPITVAAGHDRARGAEAHAAAPDLGLAGGEATARWSASSPTATCASRPSSTSRSRKS